MTLYLCRYGEIFLKGQNRNQFEDALVRNIKLMAERQKQKIAVKKIHNRLLIESEDNKNRTDSRPEGLGFRSCSFWNEKLRPKERGFRPDAISQKELPFLAKVFGLVSYSPAQKSALDWDELKKTAVNFMQELRFKTFKVNAQRQNKKFPLTSPEINRELGKYLEAKTKKEVDLHQPEIELGVEVEEDCVYLFTKKILSVGGLPVGCEGRVALLVDDEDSLRAGVLMMKRGCAVYPFALKGKDISLLQEYSPFPLELKRVKKIKEIETWAEKEKVGVLVIGQRMESFKELKTEMVVFRPLIGDLEELKKKIIFESYLKTGTLSDEEWKFCENADWHPVDELPLKEKFIKQLEPRKKEKFIKFKSVDDIFR